MTRDQERGLILLIGAGLLVGGLVLLWPRARAPVDAWVRPIAVPNVAVVAPIFLEARRVDVNVAGVAELMELPGVGPVLAERIVAYREAHGPFATLDAVAGVKGVGPALIERWRELATAGDGG